jgi:hypothetical protein
MTRKILAVAALSAVRAGSCPAWDEAKPIAPPGGDRVVLELSPLTINSLEYNSAGPPVSPSNSASRCGLSGFEIA